MQKLICHITDVNHGDHLGIDEGIARIFGWSERYGSTAYNPTKVAAFRGVYDQNALEHGKEPLIPNDVVNPTKEQIEEAAKKLENFMEAMRRANAVRVINNKKNVPKAYDILRHAFSIEERHNNVAFISNLFSQEVDRLLQQQNNNYLSSKRIPREAVINGFSPWGDSGQRLGGVPAILEAVYNRCMEKRQMYYMYSKKSQAAYNYFLKRIEDAKLPNARRPEDRNLFHFSGAPKNATEFEAWAKGGYEAYTKLLQHWQQFIPFVMRDLVNKEGVKINIKADYMTAASTENYDAESIAAKWDVAESVKEGWQRNNDKESAYAEIGQQVRRFISTIYEVETVPIYEIKGGKRVYAGVDTMPIYNALGGRVYKDPVQVHQYLSEFFRGIQSQKDLMDRLITPGTDRARVPWMQPLVNIVTSNPKLATQLFVDFKRNFQPYSMMAEDKKKRNGALKKMKTFILNKSKNLLKNKYITSFSNRGVHPINVKVWGFTPVFEEGSKGGKVNWERLAELREYALQWVYEEAPEIPRGALRHGSKVHNAPKPSWLTDRRKDAVITVDGKEERLTYEKKRDFLLEVFTSLGFDITVDTVDSILNSTDIYRVREQLEQLFNPNPRGTQTGLTYTIANVRKPFLLLTNPRATEEEKKEALVKLNNAYPNYKRLYNQDKGYQANGELLQPVKEHTEKLLDIISKHQEGKRLEGRARYQDNTLFSFVKPSYLGDRLETIESFVNKDDHEGLLNFLKEEYLQSSFFVDDEYLATNGERGKILNMWLADLVDTCKGKRKLIDTVANIFNYERDLGNETKKFEDFTLRDHGVDMLIHFFADEQQHKSYDGRKTKDPNRKMSALYPVFILGDSGVSKYIRAPRIASNVALDGGDRIITDDTTPIYKTEYRFDEDAKSKVVDAFWNIYKQEKRRMAVEEAMTFKFYANGKEVKHPKGEFSFLTFLNKSSQEYCDDYYIPKGFASDEQRVKDVIRKYLENATLHNIQRKDGTIIPCFKQRLQDAGLLELAKDGKGKEGYKHLSSVMNPQNVDSKLTEFYWNTMLATAMQMQLLTIDPWFYTNTKDLQKRYKENHAPGNCVDIHAIDHKGNLYLEEKRKGMETVAYFKDLKLNAETYNPEFMESILRTFAKPGVDVDAAIAEGILKPATNNSEAIIKRNKLIDILGNDVLTRVYEPYMSNTLTDGQGYRTLKSYRRVMGMYGKWTEDMEAAYDYIMDIRKKCADEGRSITKEEREKIASFALVLQPIKPFMFTHEQIDVKIQKTDGKGNKLTDDNGQPIYMNTKMYIPVQHKYAEALIIPELLPEGSKLRDLGLWMDENDVDLIGSDKICKVGCFGQCDLSAVTDNQSLREALNTAKIHKLPYKDYRIQTNVPEHINVSRLFGTQIRKLIMSGLKAGTDYSKYLGIDGINLSTDGETNTECKLYGQNLLALYNSLICANIMDSYDKFEKNASDIDTLAEMLQQSTIGNTRESMDNLFSFLVKGNSEESKRFAVPLFEGGLEHDASALILSTFRKMVNKQQIDGGSAVQVSAFGINGYSESGDLRFVQDPDNKANILYAEIEMPFAKTVKYTTVDERGKSSTTTVALNYDLYCNEDGTLKPGTPLKKGDKDYKKYLSYTYKKVDGKLVPCSHTDPNAEVYVPKIEQDYPGILNIIAYRIPTEAQYSMLNCQIKRFSSKMAGGTLKVPAQGTTIASFDFDIDKLYFMMREYHKKINSSFKEDHFSEDQKYKIWNAIYKDYRDLQYLLNERREEEFGNVRNNADVKPLNSYFNEINGSQYTQGKTKGELFKEYAMKLGIEPTYSPEEGKNTERLEEYNFSKTPEQNSRIARNNLLIDLMQARLMDVETMKQRYTPGGYEEASATARFLRELQYGDLEKVYNGETVDIEALKNRKDAASDPEPNYNVLDPYTILVYNQQNQLAAKLIGIFANQNTHTAFVSCLDEFSLKKSIDFCGHSKKDLLHKDSPEAAESALRVAQFLAASVDAVKDPVLNFMNLNTLTADSAALLARLGYSMDEIGLLLSQPIIVDICQETFNSGKNIRTVISNMQTKLSKYIKGSPETMKNPSVQALAVGIIKNRKSKETGEDHEKFLKENAALQYAVLNLFKDIQKSAQDVSDFVTSTKFTASNAVGSTFGALYAQQLKVNSYLSKFKEDHSIKGDISYTLKLTTTSDGTGLMNTPIDNNSTLLNMSKQDYLKYVRFNPFAYEQAMYDTNRKAVIALSKYFPYETDIYKGVRSNANDIARYGNLSEDDINSLHKDLPVYLLAKQTLSDFYGEGLHRVKNDEGKYVKANITNREYYREQFAGDLVTMLGKDPKLAELEIFKYMIPEEKTFTYKELVEWEDKLGTKFKTLETKQRNGWVITLQDVGGMNAEIKEAIKESWESLMDVDDMGNFKNPKYAELGKDLFMYCYYQMGYQFSPISFMHLAPTDVKEAIRFDLADSQPINVFKEGDIDIENSNSDDILVWSASSPGAIERLIGNYDINYREIGEIQGNTYRMADELRQSQVLMLVNTAISHPELKFKIDLDFTQEGFDMFSSEKLGKNIPSNIYFSQNTIDNVDTSKVAANYGRTVSYTQFLNSILNDDIQSIDTNDFLKQWILNHPDNARFICDINRCNNTLVKHIEAQAEESLKATKRNKLTIDVSSIMKQSEAKNDGNNILGDLVKMQTNAEGKILNASWAPCIVYNNTYYIAENGDNSMLFNTNRSTSMTYVKVAPLGCSKSLNYNNNQETLSPSMRYQSYFGEEGEDLGNAEYTRQVAPTQAELAAEKARLEEEEKKQNVTVKPSINTSTVGQGNRDASDVSNALNALKEFAENNSIEAEGWEEALDNLLDLDLRDQVLNEDDPLNDDTYDAVEEVVKDTVGKPIWRRCGDALKESLIKAVFDYNKNPKYLKMESPVQSEGSNEELPTSYLNSTVRNILEQTIIKEYIAAFKYRDNGISEDMIKAIEETTKNSSDTDLQDTIADIAKACRENGILMLDADGNLQYGC